MKVTSFEEACQYRGYNPATVLPDVSGFPEKHQQSLVAIAKGMIIAEAINEDWEADWNDSDQPKYYPWFDMETEPNNPTGFRFCGSYSGFTGTAVPGGSRLCYKTRALSDYAGKTFVDLYRIMMK